MRAEINRKTAVFFGKQNFDEQESKAEVLEKAQQMTGHSSPSATKLYDGTSDVVSLDQMEQVVFQQDNDYNSCCTNHARSSPDSIKAA